MADVLQKIGSDLLRDRVKHQNSASEHVLESFNWLVETGLQEIYADFGPICPEVGNRRQEVSISNITLSEPTNKEKGTGLIHRTTPHEALIRGLTYGSQVFVDIRSCAMTRENETAEWVITDDIRYVQQPIHKLPMVVKGRGCVLESDADLRHGDPKDPGGYFIIKGQEKVLVGQERVRANFIHVKRLKDSDTHELQCEVRSGHGRKMRATSTLYAHVSRKSDKRAPAMTFNLPYLKHDVPLAAMFRMLGVETPQDMLIAIGGPETETEFYHDLLGLDLIPESVATQTDVYAWVAAKCPKKYVAVSEKRGPAPPAEYEPGNQQTKPQYVKHLMDNEFIPHVGSFAVTGVPDAAASEASTEAMYRRVAYLGLIARKCGEVSLGKRHPDSMDDAANKRLSTVGVLMAQLIRQHVRRLFKRLEAIVRKGLTDGAVTVQIPDVVSTCGAAISGALKYALATGNWGIQNVGQQQTGFSQQLQRASRTATISHLRRVNLPINRESKSFEPRQLQPSSFGVTCPVESPEGAACGLLKNLTWGAFIAQGYPPQAILDALLSLDGIRLHCQLRDELPEGSIQIAINGSPVARADGFTNRTEVLAALRQARVSGTIPFDVSISSCPDHGVEVMCESGNYLRAVVRVDRLRDFVRLAFRNRNADPRDSMSQMVSRGIVEYIDRRMQECDLRVAVRFAQLEKAVTENAVSGVGAGAGNPPVSVYTHVDPDPSISLLGACASAIPFSNHNQSARNMFQSAMSKQTIGHAVYGQRCDTNHHFMHTPQCALVKTAGDDLLDHDEYPSGQNVCLMVVCAPNTDEDETIMSQGAIDRGLLRSSIDRPYRDSIKNVNSDVEAFERPGPDTQGKLLADFSALNPHSAVAEAGTWVEPGGAVIGKTVTMGSRGGPNRKVSKRCRSTLIKPIEGGEVTRTTWFDTKDGQRSVVVNVVSDRVPEIGDKFSGKHGQKGVVGRIMADEDMPYSLQDGIRPDMIMNTHSYSRNTVGQKMEMIAGMVAACLGVRQEGSAFRERDMFKFGDLLIKFGYSATGKQTFARGDTGEIMNNVVFFGIVTIQKLRHMAIDKMHVRAEGLVNYKTRQPIAGRARDGGLRFGEMEKTLGEGYGASHLLHDRLMLQSDPHPTVICARCGTYAMKTPTNEQARQEFNLQHSIAGSVIGYCVGCKSSDKIVPYTGPYAWKLLSQKLQAMHIKMFFSMKKGKSANKKGIFRSPEVREVGFGS